MASSPEMPSTDYAQNHQTIRARARMALDRGDFEWLEKCLAEGELNLAELTENLRIYQAELELQNAELRVTQANAERMATRYNTLFTSTPQAILVVDRRGLILEANQEATRLFGLKNRHLRQHYLPRLVAKDFNDHLDVALRLAWEAGASHANQIQFLIASGGRFEGELHLARLPAEEDDECHFICAVVDLSERLRQEMEIRSAYARSVESETRYRVLADYSADWDYWMGEDGCYRYISPACEEICGYGPEAFQADTDLLQRLIHPDDWSLWLDHSQHMTHDENSEPSPKLELRLCRPDGEIRWIEHQCRPVFGPEGAHLGWRGVNRDITARKQSELILALQKRRADALLELPRAAEELDEVAFMQRSLALAELLTDSAIGFMHFVHDDQDTIEFVAWSQSTLEQGCKVTTSDRHHPVNEAGMWADALRRGKPVIHNDYMEKPDQQGLPDGHLALHRFVSVPVIESGLTRMIAGVGNKTTVYTELDLESVQLIANATWRIMRQRRTDQAFRKSEARFRNLSTLMSDIAYSSVETAPNCFTLDWVNGAVETMTGYRHDAIIALGS